MGINEWNNKTADITGFTKEEALNKPLVSTFIVPTLRQSVQEVMDNALRGIETSNYELEFRTKSNEVRYLLVNATSRCDVENNIVGVVGVAQDVTEATRHLGVVASMANELRQFVDTANAPVFGIDVHGNVNEWNDKTAEITGFSREEALNMHLVSTFIVPSLRPSVQEVLDRALSGTETSNYDLDFETKSKEIRYLLVNATTRRDAENNIVGVVGVAQDVTDDRKHSKELREMQYIRASQEAKVETERNMTAYFAHELRNPLHAIDSALQLMPNTLSAEAQQLIESMFECTSFMSSIMNNLLDVRKMEEGKMRLNRAPLSLKKLLKSVHNMLTASVRPGVEMISVYECGDRKDWVIGDSHRIQQILTNVITNAIKYTAVGRITLSMKWIGTMLRFECADTGPGIPKHDQTKLFQRFVTRGGAPGTGLGLAISKHLVDLVGGKIGFESDPSLRPGTTCVVELPLIICDPRKGSMNMASLDVKAIEPIKDKISFLIVDDIRISRMMLRRRIQKSLVPNATITEAPTGEKALEICKDMKFDVIIMDQHIEEAGGLLLGTDTVVAMRREKIDSVIIGCSGNDIDDEFMEAGTDWAMGKPTPANSVILHHLKLFLSKRKLEKDKDKMNSIPNVTVTQSTENTGNRKKRNFSGLETTLQTP